MKNNQIQKNIPNGWLIVPLGSLGEIVTGNTPSTKDLSNYIGSHCWATAEDFKSKYIFDTNIKLSDSGKKYSRFLPIGSVLVTCIASIGKNAIAKVPLATNQQINAIIVNSKNNNEFVYYWIQNSVPLLKRTAGAGAMQILNKNEFSKLKICVPPLPEQKRIVSVLETWDKAIEKLVKKIEFKKNIKKGLMQRLLTGDLRLAGFSKPWDVFRLGDISKMSSGGTPLSKVGRYYNGNILWVSIADMTKQGKYITDTEKKLTEEGLQDSAAKVYPVGTILYAMYASIGECGIAIREMTSSQAILGIEPDKNRLNNIYLYYFLTYLKDEIKLLGQQGTQSNLNAGIVKDFKINLPVIEEQKNIVNVLQLADNEIDLFEKKLTKLKEQKNYLLNNLITGTIRTPETMKIKS